MNLNQLEYFVSIAQTLSYTRSAELLHVTQSALTHAINKLEEELTSPLFYRDGKKISLTPCGDIFYKYCAAALHSIECGVNEVKKQSSEQVGHLSIAIVNNMDLEHFEPIIEAFREQYPKINIHFYEDSYVEVLKAIKTHVHNFAICGLREETLKQQLIEYFPIIKFSSYAFMHKSNPLTQMPYLSNYDLQNEHTIYLSEDARQAVSRSLPDLVITDYNSTVCTSLRLALNIVNKQKGILLKISPTTFEPLGEDIIGIPLKNTDLHFGFIWNSSISLSNTEKLFIDFLSSLDLNQT